MEWRQCVDGSAVRSADVVPAIVKGAVAVMVRDVGTYVVASKANTPSAVILRNGVPLAQVG